MSRSTPEDWRVVSLSDVADYVNGRAFKPTEWGTAGRPIIRIQNLTNPDAPANRFGGDVEPRHIVNDGDLLFSWSATLGSFVYRGEQAVLNQHIFNVQPRPGYSKKFLYYLLNYAVHGLKRQVHGTGMQHITKGVLASQQVSVPHSEHYQDVIADKVDELFSDVDAGERSVVGVVRVLPAANASLLDAAYSGFLTRDVPDPSTGIPTSWHWMTIGDKSLSDVVAGLTKNDARRKNLSLEVPYLRVANVQKNELMLDEVKTIRVTGEEAQKKSLRKGDLLVVEGNGSPEQIGRVALWDGSIPKCVHQNHIIRVRFNERVNPSFALYWLMSARGRAAVAQRASTTSGLYTLSKGKVESLPLPVADRAVQDQIVDLVDEEMSRLVALSAYAESAAATTTNLRQSILAAAFSGHLV